MAELELAKEKNEDSKKQVRKFYEVDNEDEMEYIKPVKN